MSSNKKTSDSDFILKMSLGYIALLFFIVLIAALFFSNAVNVQDLSARLQSPSFKHIFGTDILGRDLFLRVLFGARVSIFIAILAAVISVFVGVFVGSLSGYYGGYFDFVLMRVTDFVSIFPTLLVSILCTLFLGHSVGSIVFSLSIISWVYSARIVRSLVIKIKQNTHVEAARAMGAGPIRIFLKHVFPNLRSQIAVILGYQIPSLILTESFLSFVGLGLQPPHASWGTLVADGFHAMQSYPYLFIMPGTTLFLLLLAMQTVVEKVFRDLRSEYSEEFLQ